MKDKFYSYFWFPLLGVLAILLLVTHGKMRIATVVGIISYFVVSIVTAKLLDKKKAKEFDEYRKKYITEVECDLEEFGVFQFEWDKYKSEINLTKGVFPCIAGDEITVVMIESDNENLNVILDCLRLIYANKSLIRKLCCDYAEETYKLERITEVGNTLITYDYIMEKLFLDSINMYIEGNSVSAVIYGGIDIDIEDHIAEHGVAVNIFSDGRIELD